MKVIEKEMLQAIESGDHWGKDNTSIRHFNGVAQVFLFGNHIADVHADGGVVVNRGTLLEYPTVTTKSRLRALGVNVVTKKGVTYLNGDKV